MTCAVALRTRIAVLSAVSVALAIGAMATSAYFLFDRELHRQLDVGLTRETNGIKLRMAARAGPGDSGDCAWIATPACSQIITKNQTAPLPGVATRLPITTEAREVAAGTRGAFHADVTVDGHPLRMLTTPLDRGRALQVAVRSDGVLRSLDRTGKILFAAGAGGIALALLIGYLVARAGLRPLADIAAASRHIAGTRDAGHRISVRGDDEVAQLARSFNTMLEALEESITAQRRLVADASHELRTPLTSLRSDIDLLAMAGPIEPEQQNRILGRIHHQFEELTHLVVDLIELARGDEPAEHTEDVRLDRLVHHALANAGRHFPRIDFRAELESTLLTGIPERLTRAIANLLDNAAKFSPDNGTVTVTLRRGELSVSDTGPGIPSEDLPRVFDRFYRAPAARALPGSGLGLAIVAQVARTHGAHLRADSPPSGGTEITLTFPAAEPLPAPEGFSS